MANKLEIGQWVRTRAIEGKIVGFFGKSFVLVMQKHARVATTVYRSYLDENLDGHTD